MAARVRTVVASTSSHLSLPHRRLETHPALALAPRAHSQPYQLGIFRSDYLLHSMSQLQPLEIKQVEFNTIASSFGALSQRAGEMHK